MKYIRTKDGIKTSDKVTHELINDISDAGYFKRLEKGSYVRIGKEWVNFYGRWVDIIDESGCHYSIRPDEVKRVTKELLQADTIEELCDEFVHGRMTFRTLKECLDYAPLGGEVYGAIWFKGEHNEPILKSIAKMNDKGELVLL